jgi:FMN phosphatase YigB (HAD superfamily)
MHTQPVPQFTTLILDLGDVLLDWTSHNTNIPSSAMRRIIATTTWFAYERGAMSQKDCFLQLSLRLNLDFDEVKSAFEQAHLSIAPKYEVIDLVRKLKAQSQGLLRILAMSNMPRPNFERLRPMFQSWNIFDDYYISCNVGERKPSLRFFSHVIEAASIEPSKAVFLDDKLDNVLAARSFGIHGIVFDETGPALRRLSDAFSDDSCKRGWKFIISNAGKLESITDAGEKICENFAQLLILEVTQDR